MFKVNSLNILSLVLLALSGFAYAATSSTDQSLPFTTPPQAMDQYLNYQPKQFTDNYSSTASPGVNDYYIGNNINQFPVQCPKGQIMVSINNHANTPTYPTYWEHDNLISDGNFSWIPRCADVNWFTLKCESRDYVQEYTQVTNKQIGCVPVTWEWEKVNANPDPANYPATSPLGNPNGSNPTQQSCFAGICFKLIVY